MAELVDDCPRFRQSHGGTAWASFQSPLPASRALASALVYSRRSSRGGSF